MFCAVDTCRWYSCIPALVLITSQSGCCIMSLCSPARTTSEPALTSRENGECTYTPSLAIRCHLHHPLYTGWYVLPLSTMTWLISLSVKPRDNWRKLLQSFSCNSRAFISFIFLRLTDVLTHCRLMYVGVAMCVLYSALATNIYVHTL